jgi:hypothetical protein
VLAKFLRKRLVPPGAVLLGILCFPYTPNIMDNVTSFLASQSLSDATRGILDAAPRQWLPYALGILVGYPLLASSLRYQRLRNMHKKYPYATREDMANMTDDHAFEIQKATAQLEFPFMFVKALQFALFRVCIILSHIHS